MSLDLTAGEYPIVAGLPEDILEMVESYIRQPKLGQYMLVPTNAWEASPHFQAAHPSPRSEKVMGVSYTILSVEPTWVLGHLEEAFTLALSLRFDTDMVENAICLLSRSQVFEWLETTDPVEEEG